MTLSKAHENDLRNDSMHNLLAWLAGIPFTGMDRHTGNMGLGISLVYGSISSNNI